MKFLCAVPRNSPQRDITLLIIYYTHADLQLRDIVALSAVRKSRVDTRIELFVSLTIFLMIISTTVRKTCACAEEIPGTR